MSLSLSVLVSTAQTQQGYTKTVGKENKPGEPLSGVTVRINGNINSVLSDENGHFSFPVISKQFKVSRVAKKGYELADPDIVGQPYGITYNTPFVIPFISTEELRKIINAIEDQTRQKLEKEFAEQNAELEALKERKKLSDEEFGKKLTELETKYNDLGSLVQKLAERYAFTDYDNIDSTRLQINQAIEQGDVERAVQLIKSMGNIAERIKKIEEKENQGRILTQIGDKQLQEAQTEKEELAADLKQLAAFHYDQHCYDSAYICLEQRYLLDTTSVVYLYDLVFLYPFDEYNFSGNKRNDWRSSQQNCLQKLSQHISELGTMLDMDTVIVGASIESKIADLYSFDVFDEYERQTVIDHYMKAYSLRQQAKDGDAWIELVNIGHLYTKCNEYEKAIDRYREALNNCKSLAGKSILHIQIADLYDSQNIFNKAIKEYTLAEHYKDLMIQKGRDGDKDYENLLDYEIFVIQGYLALLMTNEGQQKKAVAYGEKAINNAREKYERSKSNRDIFPIIALYKQQYDVYSQLKDFKKMLQCAEGAVEYAERYMQRMTSSKSRLLYAESLSLLADVHASLGKIDLAKEELIECLKKAEIVYNVYGDRYFKLCSNIYASFATCYARQKQYTQALHAIDKSISCSPTMPKAYQRKLDILHEIGETDDALVVEQRLRETQNDYIVSKKYNYSLLFYKLDLLYNSYY